MQVGRYRLPVVLLVILSGVTPFFCAAVASNAEPAHSKVVQDSYKPYDTLIDRLLDFLPGYMNEKQVPGCAISLIEDHKIVWAEGFGFKNAFTKKPVEAATVFEVASNSKFIAAWIAMLLVEEGKLTLDSPLNSYLTEPWLPDTVYREAITLRHVLSHSSGLGHNNMNRKVDFPPGTGYQYSNLGFIYLQAVIEEITGQTLEQVASDLVFEPAGMSGTSYTNNKNLRKWLANGHVDGTYLIGFSGILFFIPVLLVWVPGMLLFRIRRKRWIPPKRLLIYGSLLTVVLWLVITFTFFGIIGWVKYAWQITFFGFIFLSVSVLLYLGGVSLIQRLTFLNNKSIRILAFVWIILTLTCQVAVTKRMHNIPVPRWPAVRPTAPASLRTTATDMSRFLLEISKTRCKGVPVYKQMLDPQVRLHPEISWGLGTGIFHSPQGDALWQWGQNVDFQSLVMFWPEKGSGIIVLTNSEWGQPDVAIEIAQQALGLNLESIIRASHLEFSFEGEAARMPQAQQSGSP